MAAGVLMRGSPFSYVDLEKRIPERHPLHKINDLEERP